MVSYYSRCLTTKSDFADTINAPLNKTQPPTKAQTQLQPIDLSSLHNTFSHFFSFPIFFFWFIIAPVHQGLYRYYLPSILSILSMPPKQPCKYFQKGACRFGDRCKFLHSDVDITNASTQQVFLNQDPNTLANEIVDDLNDYKHIHMNPALSAYGTGEFAVNNLIEGRDMSPEELRLQYMQALLNNTVNEYNRNLELRSKDMDFCVGEIRKRTTLAARYQQVGISNPGQMKPFIDKTVDQSISALQASGATGAGTGAAFGGQNPFGASVNPFGAQNSGFGAAAASGASPFGSSSTTPSPFGNGASGSGFGSSGFGNAAAAQTATSANSGPSGPSGGSAFGASGFGSTNKPSGSSGFGSAGFGSAGFGSAPKSGASAFGAAGFGSTATSGGAFGLQTVAGQSGQSAFGNSAGASAFGTAAPSGFGTAAFGTSSLGAKPAGAFGTAGFGSSSGNNGNSGNSGNAPANTAFGSSGFGSAGFGSTQASSTAAGSSGFGSSGFGSSGFSQAPSAFGTATFGAQTQNTATPAAPAAPAESGKSAFGASSFGAPAPSAQSAFGQSKPVSEPPLGSGFGGFSSSIETTSQNPFGQSSAFGSANSATSATAARSNVTLADATQNPALQKLDPAVAQAFAAREFQIGAVPDIPPPPEVC